MKPITKTEILSALTSVGVEKGNTVIVHASLKKIGYLNRLTMSKNLYWEVPKYGL